MLRSPAAIVATSSVVAFAIPPFVFMVVAVFEGMGFGETLTAVIEQYSAARQNLAVLGLVGVIPLVLLGVVVWALRFFKRAKPLRRRLAVGGATAIALVLVWVNAQFWPTFLPNKTYAGFPHGLEFVIGPLIFAPVAMVVGMIIAALSRPSNRLPE